MSIDLASPEFMTRLLVAGSFAVAACATAYRRRFGYTIFYLLAAAEMYANYRYEFVALVRELLLGSHPSAADKYAIQTKVLIVAALVGVALMFAIVTRLKRTSAELMLALGTAGVLAEFTVETISYHFVDAFIYTIQGGVTRSAWLYAAATLVAIVGALRLPRRRQDRR